MSQVNDFYLSPEDAALQVVATAIKKKHLRTETLVINSLLGGIFLSVSGMLALSVQAGCRLILQDNPFIVHLLQGLMFTPGLVFIIMMGVDLFNSNILFFTVATLHRKTSIWALLKSWIISLIFNLAGCLIQVYIVNHLGGLTETTEYIEASIEIATAKVLTPNWGQIFMRGLASNFLVCLAIYLQVMSRPFIAKVVGITLPIFSFVVSGYDHVVADMFFVPAGMINGAPVSVGLYIYKSLIPVTLGNIVGGVIFSVSVPWYLHIYIANKAKNNAIPLFTNDRHYAKDIETVEALPDISMSQDSPAEAVHNLTRSLSRQFSRSSRERSPPPPVIMSVPGFNPNYPNSLHSGRRNLYTRPGYATSNPAHEEQRVEMHELSEVAPGFLSPVSSRSGTTTPREVLHLQKEPETSTDPSTAEN